MKLKKPIFPIDGSRETVLGSSLKTMLLAIGFLLSLSSCIKEEFDPDRLDPSLQFDAGVAAPIGWARYKLSEILTDSLSPGQELILDADSFITLQFTEEIFSASADEMISIDDVSLPGNDLTNDSGLPIDLSRLVTADTLITTIEVTIPVQGLSGAAIDSIWLNSLDLVVTASSVDPTMDWEIRISSPDISGFQQIILDPANATAQQSFSGATIRLNNNPPASNEMQFVISMILRDGSITISPGATIFNLDLALGNMEFAGLFGYLGQFNIGFGQMYLPIGFFDEFSAGTFRFADPKLKLLFDNSFGIPVAYWLDQFEAETSAGFTIPFSGPGVPTEGNEDTIDYPAMDLLGTSARDSIEFNADNSNIEDVLASSPTGLEVIVRSSTNPAGPPLSNFILDTSQLSVSARLILPLEGYSSLALVSDTLDFVFDDFYENPPEEIEKMIFRMNFINQFPVEITSQVYFLDENYAVLDSLFHDMQDPRRIVEGATDADGDGKAEPRTLDPVEVELTRTQIDNISSSHYVIVSAWVITTNAPDNVRLYSDYFFHAFVGAIARVKVNSTDF